MSDPDLKNIHSTCINWMSDALYGVGGGSAKVDSVQSISHAPAPLFVARVCGAKVGTGHAIGLGGTGSPGLVPTTRVPGEAASVVEPTRSLTS